MTSYIYPSVFSGEPALDSGATSTGVTESSSTPGIFTPQSTASEASQGATSQGLASFICHVAYLDDKLQRGDRSAFFTAGHARLANRKRIGNGLSFIVERAELDESQDSEASQTARSKAIVVKTVREDRHHRNQWGEVLLEIRALLHEPIRYHPNIVRLFDIRWDASTDTGSPFPAIVQEYATYGTLDKLQQRSAPLPFSIKQKLCYDVGRALSIIHACGMVHGDLKHENVLIFPNLYPDPPNQPYTAKLADFGGTVMDMGGDGKYRIPMHTFPFEAPEVSESLTEEEAKKTDAYSYGMLIWRCMIDSDDSRMLSAMGVASDSRGRVQLGDSTFRDNVRLLKLSDAVLEAALHSVSSYCFTNHVPQASLNIITSALMFTLRGDPKQRALDRAQVRLRGLDPVNAYRYVGIKDDANRRTAERQKYRTPGRHGMDMDSVGFGLGRLGNDYDAQNNLPGFRPDLPRPERGGFLFEPLHLRNLLSWSQQEAMVRDFELFAKSESPSAGNGIAEIKPNAWTAAYFLFQAYLCGFGISYDPWKACEWLRRAAEPDDEEAGTDYLALAWLNRIHTALGVPNPYDADKQIDNLFWSTIRGHRHCVRDAEAIIQESQNAAQRQAWMQKMDQADMIYRLLTGSTGMPFFAPRKLTREWDLNNLDALDSQIREELGNEYESCLRPSPGSEDASDPPPESGYRFDKIYINHKGHGLIHLAALQGNLAAIKHIHQKYLCDINLRNQSHGDTALVCACRTGRLNVAMWCLENGADPNPPYSEEAPLHCIDSFPEHEMDIIVTKLIAAGADIEKHSEASRKDVRGILADWEDSCSMTLAPLGRAVLKQSLPAVKILLKHGASPTGKRVNRNRANQSPIELAAVLTLPDILEELLRHVRDGEPVFDECEMLDAAHAKTITPYDSLSLHSRLVRCGGRYKENLEQTLRILQERSKKQNPEKPVHSLGKHLCNEILLGNADIVSTLLSLGHSPSGSPGFRPLLTAVEANHAEIFQQLIDQVLDLTVPDAEPPSLLHALASRPRHTPRDLSIAKYLLAAGVPAETISQTHPSPLVLAILHGDFDLADLLITHGAGASLNTLHPATAFSSLPSSTPPSAAAATKGKGPWHFQFHYLTLLGYLLPSQTSSALRALIYLARLHKDPAYTNVTLSPLVGLATTTAPLIHPPSTPSEEVVHLEGRTTAIEVSAVHALAIVSPEEWNSHNQISASIIQTVVGMFPEHGKSLGEWEVNPVMGDVLEAAVRRGNAELVRALVGEVGYRALLFEDGGNGGNAEEGKGKRVVELARRVLKEELEGLERRGSREATEDKVRMLRRWMEIVEVLEEVGGQGQDGEGEQICDIRDIRNRILKLELGLKPDFEEPEIDRTSEEVNMPADLSVLTDEKPSGWKEGVEMTGEMSLRIFLKHFRKANDLFGDEIVKAMGKLFNKRSDDGEEGAGKG